MMSKYDQLISWWHVCANKTKAHGEEGKRKREYEYEVLVFSEGKIIKCTYQEEYPHHQL